jgi:DNA-binding MarR family transcriptional regulator
MTSGISQSEAEKTRIMLGLLDSIERGGQSQRRLAAELGVALGLVNAYLRRCVNKGLVKVSEIPARRYAYYLTPQGFAEKSRLTAEYLSYSFGFFRQAKVDCAEVFAGAARRGFTRLVLVGKSDLAEIAAICAADGEAAIVAVVDPACDADRFLGVPVVASFDTIVVPFDAVVVTDMTAPRDSYARACQQLGADRVLVPELLRVSISQQGGAAQ